MTDQKIMFSPNQSLPDGYSVEWWPSDEMYHWVHDPSRYHGEPEVYSEGCCCRFMARRGAIRHSQKEPKP